MQWLTKSMRHTYAVRTVERFGVNWSWISPKTIHETIAEWIRRLLWQCYDEIRCKLQGSPTKTDVTLFFTITNCRSSTYRINYKFMYLSTYWQWKLANESVTISAVIIKCSMTFHYSDCLYFLWHAIKIRIPQQYVLGRLWATHRLTNPCY